MAYTSKLAREFEKWLGPKFEEEDTDIIAADLLVIIGNLIARMRSTLTLAETSDWLQRQMIATENRLQNGVAFVDGHGNDLNLLLAEEKEALGDESFTIPDSVPEDWS